MNLRLLTLTALAALGLGACPSPDPTYKTVQELMDPETCKECHPKHYQEWSGSMHAYAGEDPVFLAMNKRGQAETNGQLGDFCINCHAPMAKRLGLSADGLNLAEVPAYAKGVTCFFCHNVSEVTDDHNNPLILANDQTMRAALHDPVDNPAHASAYSGLVDGDAATSSPMCGACHDLRTPKGVHLERTYEEWQASVFATTDPPSALGTCAGCHMHGVKDVVADNPDLDVPLREGGRHEHQMEGVDIALTPFPEMADQRARLQYFLDTTVAARLCVLPDEGGRITLRLDNVGAGHMFPSGSSQDRRAWAEIIAYDADDNVVFQTGVVPDGMDPEDVADPSLWGMFDRAVNAAGDPEPFFWNIDRIDDPPQLLPPSVTNDPNSDRFDHSVTRSFPVGVLLPQIAKVTARVQLRPIPLHLVDELTADGLDPALRDAVPTYTLAGTVRTWTMATAGIDRCVD